jgi:hypothetical protein
MTHKLLITAAIVAIAFAPRSALVLPRPRFWWRFWRPQFLRGVWSRPLRRVWWLLSGLLWLRLSPVLLLLLLTRDSWGPNGAALALIKARHFSLVQAWPGCLGAAMPANCEAAFVRAASQTRWYLNGINHTRCRSYSAKGGPVATDIERR